MSEQHTLSRPSDVLTDPAAWTVLRVAAALCFVGHGAFGVIGKADWLQFFAVAGIGPAVAWQLMPIVGAVDVAVGLAVLVAPRRATFLYMALWALWTAALRPLAGLPVWETLERAGNYGAPLALLAWSGGMAGGVRGLFAPARPALGASGEARVARLLAWTTGLLLVGHGALALSGKALLVRHAALLGLGPHAVVAQGAGEVALGVACALRPSRPLLLAAVAWKLGTELLFLPAGARVWEVVERAGSYGAPLALALLLAGASRRAWAGRRETGEALAAGR